MMSPTQIFTPSRLPEVPSHLYGTRAAIFFLMHPSRASDHKTSKPRKYRLSSNAKASFAPVNTVNMCAEERKVKTNAFTPIVQVEADEFHFNSTRLN